MKAEQILGLLRPLVLVVDENGQFISVHGGHGGFLGHDLDALCGSNVFDHVVPDEVDQLALYFAENVGMTHEAASLPMPFNVTFIGGDGLPHSIDVIATRNDTDDGRPQWVVVAVPIALDTTVSRSLDSEMEGKSRAEVRRALTEELVSDNEMFSSRWFLVDFTDPSAVTVTTSREEDAVVAETIATLLDDGWTPWESLSVRDCTSAPIESLPEPLPELAAGNRWRRVIVAPVAVDGVMVACYLMLSRVPETLAVDEINANVMTRIRKLVDVTSLLMTRWRDQDRLVSAATRDPLTGLANRDCFADAMSAALEGSSILYVDVDHFKTVNDRLGHAAGDRVLVEVARRIVRSCRPEDVVARFGGDEFVVLLEGVGPAKARAIGHRIIEEVGAPMQEDGVGLLSVSVGVSSVAGAMEDAVNRADRAMMLAKQQGRARVVSADQTA